MDVNKKWTENIKINIMHLQKYWLDGNKFKKIKGSVKKKKIGCIDNHSQYGFTVW